MARFPPSKRVKVFCDSENAWKIISIGSSKPHLQNIAIDIFNLCLQNDFEIEAQWLPREQNQIADQLSRFVDKDDWSINHEVFKAINLLWGPHMVDRFASKFTVPHSEAVYALAQDWRGENNWLCPPTHLILKTIRHLHACRASETLIIPQWPSNH